MKKVIFAACVLAGLVVFFGTLALSEEKAAKKAAPLEWKVKGELIPHPDTGDIKVLTENYEALTFGVDKNTKITANVKAKVKEMAMEGEFKLPKGEVTYTFVDGKPVATKVTYGSGETWKMEPPKPKED